MKATRIAVLSLLLAGCAGGSHMQRALDDLRSARAELEAAEPNKGGHREKALIEVDAAIEQVKKGMEFAGQPIH
jgi:hypothetical protein